MPLTADNRYIAIDPKYVIWKAGRPAELWLDQRKLIAKIIKKYELQPLEQEFYPQTMEEFGLERSAKMMEMNTDARLRMLWPFPYPGGIVGPHVHYGRDVFMLNTEQWGVFSKGVIKDMVNRLAEDGVPSMNQLLEVTEGLKNMPGRR